MTDPSLQALAPHTQPGPASAVRRLLERACLSPAPCASAVAVELAEDGARSLARVNHGSLTADEVEAARLAVERDELVVGDRDELGQVLVAVPAGPRWAVVCRLATPPAASRLERVRALGESVTLAIEAEQLVREYRKLVADRLWLEERVNQSAAYDLHDGPAQQLLWVRNMLKLLGSEPERTTADAGTLEDLRLVVASALDDVQGVISRLSATGGEQQPLERLLRDEVDLLLRRERVDVFLEIGGDLAELDPQVGLAAHRLVQEALTNAVRHGRAQRVRVAVLRRDDRVEIVVEDDGQGFDPEAVLERTMRLGLRGMRERVALLNGQLDIASRTGGPTQIYANLPVEGSASPVLVRRPD